MAYAKKVFFCIVLSILPSPVDWLREFEGGSQNAPPRLAGARPQSCLQGVKERPPGPAALSLNLTRRCRKSEGFVACKRPINDRREDL